MANKLTLRQLEYFVAALDEGTMAAAARRLATSASAVSMGISDLESVVGMTLLVRSSHRPLAATAAGHAILPDARALLDAVTELESGIYHDAHSEGGIFRFGCFTPFAPHYLPSLLAQARALDPPIALDVVDTTIDQIHEVTVSGSVEMSLMYDLGTPPSLTTEQVALHAPYLLLPHGHRLAKHVEVSLSDVVDEPMVMLDARPSQYFDDLLAKLGYSVNIVHRTRNIEAVRSMVANDLGWSLLTGPPRGGRSQDGLPLVALRLSDEVPPMPVVVAWQAGVELSTRGHAVIELCHRVVGRSSDPRFASNAT